MIAVELLQKWLSTLDLKDVVVTKKSLLCSDHFEAKCFRKTGKNASVLTLKSDAVPSLIARSEGSNSTLLPKNSEALSVPNFSIEDNGAFAAQPQETATPGTPIAERCRRIYEDHHYDTTPRSLRKKLKKSQTIISTLRNDSRIQKQKIIRLEKRITSLTHLVREIRKRKLVPQSGLQCLETIAENDVCAANSNLTATDKEIDNNIATWLTNCKLRDQRKEKNSTAREEHPVD
ncbi:THAP domain-containing protein 1-like [Leptopilina heterotoma]|uniref:THAP domain-containing protein 1-like n=1 Tax=Leptopilina heterotoma TaxID=63436 RepID=UPI001CA924F0|nr:THAP domain-containing protein 1-like [Leptopilina heterotoma]